MPCYLRLNQEFHEGIIALSESLPPVGTHRRLSLRLRRIRSLRNQREQLASLGRRRRDDPDTSQESRRLGAPPSDGARVLDIWTTAEASFSQEAMSDIARKAG